jgi:hypothetical protein
MEAIAWLAGERHSDHPVCACPVIGAFVRSWNDALETGAERDRLLKPLLPLVIGTRGNAATALQRAWMAIDWQAREATPAWLRLAGLTTEADALAGLSPITDEDSAHAAMGAMGSARSVAEKTWDAAGTAIRTVGVVVGAAIRAAASGAAWAASSTVSVVADFDLTAAVARSAAWAAASAVAVGTASGAVREATVDAARDAARDKLVPTVEALQPSAQGLVRRMCSVR